MRAYRTGLGVAAGGLVLALAGCGGGNGGGAKVPSADGGSGGSSVSATAAGGAQGAGSEAAAYVEGQRKWVACMRKNGIDLPDPDSKGRVDISGQGPQIKKSSQFISASQKCKGLMAPMPEGFEEANEPKLTPAQIKATRDYADCMQKNGAPDYPDPGPDGYTLDDNSGRQVWDQTSAGAKRATRLCAPIAGEPTDAPAGKG